MGDDIKPGDRINITIENAKVINTGRDDLGRAFIEYTHGEYNALATVDRDDPNVNVALGDPAEWPPRPGDLWRDKDGDLWFALTREKLVSSSGSPYGTNVESVSSQFAPLALVHREAEQDGGRSDG